MSANVKIITKRPKKITVQNLWNNASMLFIYILMFIILSFTVPYFFSVDNMISILLAVSSVGIVACTMLFCLASGDFDLSIEAVLPFAGVLVAILIRETGNIVFSITVAVVASAMIGLVNGLIIAKLKINALITTLAMQWIVKGIYFIICGGVAVGITKIEFYAIGQESIWGIPIPVIIMLVCFVVFGLLLNKTTYGRNTLAIGGNREAARLAGINVDNLKIFIFTIQGLIAGIAGIILASRMTSGQPNSSVGFSLDVISACVLGGVSLSGGVGTILGVIVGVLIMGTVQDAMNLLNIETFYQYVVRGVILLLAVLFDQLKQKKS